MLTQLGFDWDPISTRWDEMFAQFSALIDPVAKPQARGSRMDLRTYGIGAQILKDLAVGKMKLLASPRKMPSMTGFDLEVTGYQARPDNGGGD